MRIRMHDAELFALFIKGVDFGNANAAVSGFSNTLVIVSAKLKADVVALIE